MIAMVVMWAYLQLLRSKAGGDEDQREARIDTSSWPADACLNANHPLDRWSKAKLLPAVSSGMTNNQSYLLFC